MIREEKFLCIVIILSCANHTTSFEPFTTVGIGIAATTALFAGWNKVTCRFYECCNDEWIIRNFTKLENSLDHHLFGQHIAQDVVVRALKAHFRGSPKKALAISFHGLSGSGKTFVSQFVMDSMYSLGPRSKYAHFFAGRSHFSLASQADIYKIHLMDWIRGNVTQCGRSLFVFDEVDKMPRGVLDAIKPFLDYHEHIDGIDYRNTVFIFLSNTGSKLIVERLLSLWEKGTKREDIILRDFEDLIRKGSFNEEGGFHKSETIESDLIDHYVPFLPMEESHVRECIKAEFKRKGVRVPPEDYIKEVLKDLTFGPKPHNLFSLSGCKRISPKVAAVIEKLLFEM